MKGRLWQCDRKWRRLASQRVEFNEWPEVGVCFRFHDALGEEHTTGGVDVSQWRGDEVRFETKVARFELEKLP